MRESLSFTIPGELTTYNVYDAANKVHFSKAGKIKKAEGWRVYLACRAAFGPDARLMEDAYPVSVHFKWYRRDTATDTDNVRFAAKFILDGMQQAGLLQNDNMKHVCGLSDEYLVDKQNPRTEVIITAREGFSSEKAAS